MLEAQRLIQRLILAFFVMFLATWAGFVLLLIVAPKYKSNPATDRVFCMIGIELGDCGPSAEQLAARRAHEADLTALENQVYDMEQAVDDWQEKLDDAKNEYADNAKRLKRLKALEEASNSAMFFTHKTDPETGVSMTVGTHFSSMDDSENPSFTCYFSLDKGAAGEDRNLYYRTHSGVKNLSRQQIAKAGLPPGALEFAQKACAPSDGA